MDRPHDVFPAESKSRERTMTWAAPAWRASLLVGTAFRDMIFYPAGVRHHAAREFRSRLQLARRLAGNTNEKRRLRKALSPHLHRFADASVKREIAKANWFCVCLLLGLIAGIAAPAVAFARPRAPVPNGYSYVFVLWYFAMLVFMSLAIRGRRERDWMVLVSAINLQALGILFVLYSLPRAGRELSLLNAAAVSIIACLSIILVLFMPRFLVNRFTSRQQYVNVRRYPETVFVVELLAACELVGDPGQGWHFLSARTKFMQRINTAAIIAETYLPAAMRGYGVNRVSDERCRGMAAGLREMQTWVVDLNARTTSRLRYRLYKTLCSFASGEWGTVRVVPPARRGRSLRSFRLFLGRAGAVLLAFAMFLLSLRPGITQNIPVPLLTLIWVAVVSILVMAFPNLDMHLKPGRLLADFLIARKPKEP